MPKAYEPQQVEDALYQAWLASGYFNPDNLPNLEERTEAFSIVLPPPNVTGTLHLGHATMLAIEDAMVRFARLRGKRALWLPGTDHAAIATQSKVESILHKETGKSRHDLGREAFLEKVRAFAQESHDTIVNQCKKMGASLDWSREAYTLDEARNTAVNTAFKRMYDDGLIYRGYRVVNWDPIGQTTIADDEIVYKDVTATLYTFQYAKNIPIVIATTRPETKVGDTAIAVHPEGKWKEYIGQTFENVAFAGATITLRVISDEAVDPEFGTGALGVTPAHSSIDFDMSKRHNLPLVQVIGEDGKMMQEVGTVVSGLNTKDAREKIAQWLRDQGLMQSEEEMQQSLSTAERTGGVIEPLPKLQWFIDVNKPFVRDGQETSLKKLMQDAVRSKAIEILPDRFEKTYFHWIDNLRDWNISRQIWFGHQVPVWYKGEEIVVGAKPEGDDWVQDEDTLDTWFSSGLWTFSTLGWPEETVDFKTFHPTTVLETGYDILFFWVARMVLMSTYLVNDVPFKTVYLHGLVRDEQGRKMSKSLGNIINPLDMIEKYGADATRLALVVGNTPGNDLRLSEEKIAGYRNFTNKLWNISRFIGMKAGGLRHVANVTPVTLSDRYILGRLSEITTKMTALHEAYDLSLAGELLRDFTWSEFADWYLEIAKAEEGKEDILLYVLERLLILWHPFMPFVTEEIYKGFDQGMIVVATWPNAEHALIEADRVAFERFQEIVAAVRNVRATYKIAPSTRMHVRLVGGQTGEALLPVLSHLTRADVVRAPEAFPEAANVVAGGETVSVDLAGLVDFGKERERLTKEIASVSTYVHTQEGKLANTEFVKNAPEKVITMERAKLTDAQARLAALEGELAALAK